MVERKRRAADARTDGRAREARWRAFICGFLSRSFRREPDRRFVEDLRKPEVIEALVAVGMKLDRDELLGGPAEAVGGKLAEDYTQLFLVPGDRISLNESVHRGEEGSLLGESTVQVERFIRALGLHLDESWTELPDHLAIEFEVMRRMAGREADLWEGEDREAASRCIAQQTAFLDEHINPWVPRICAAIELRTGTVFYRELARMTAALIREEREST
jgi:TorA maturation chaperone TorD